MVSYRYSCKHRREEWRKRHTSTLFVFLLFDPGWYEKHLPKVQTGARMDDTKRTLDLPLGHGVGCILEYLEVQTPIVSHCCYIFLPICFLQLVLLCMHTKHKTSPRGEWQPHRNSIPHTLAETPGIDRRFSVCCWRGGKFTPPASGSICSGM